VQQRLTTYLLSSDADIWLITGSPQSLVEQVYFDTPWLPRVNLIQSNGARLRWLGAAFTLSWP
jgi:phosphatidylglycerophosphatase C